MINFKLTLHKLFFMHEWEEIDAQAANWYAPQAPVNGNPQKRWTTYTLRCKTCGTLKRKKIKL